MIAVWFSCGAAEAALIAMYGMQAISREDA